MERIVFLERNTIQANFRRPNFDHKWIEYAESFAEQVVERVRAASIVISNKLSLGEPQLSEAPDVKLIAIAATGSVAHAEVPQTIRQPDRSGHRAHQIRQTQRQNRPARNQGHIHAIKTIEPRMRSLPTFILFSPKIG